MGFDSLDIAILTSEKKKRGVGMKIKLDNEMTLRRSRRRKSQLFIVLYIDLFIIGLLIRKYAIVSIIVILIAIGFMTLAVYEIRKSIQEYREENHE